MKHRRPTFEMLREKRRLAVINPANGLRFTISLRDWAQCLWAVRTIRQEPNRGRLAPVETAHRIFSRESIEAWLSLLVLDPHPQRGLTVPLRDYVSADERKHRRWLGKDVTAGKLPPRVLTWATA